MKTQTYYNAPLERMANVCDMTTELCINCVGAVKESGGFTTRYVRRDYYLMYLLEGGMNIEFDGFCGSISAGDLLVMTPGTEYMYSAEKGKTVYYLWMHFTGNRAEESLSDLSVPVNRICHVGQIGSMAECWKRMFREFVPGDRHFTKMTAALFTEVMIGFSRRLCPSSGSRQLLKSILYIHENYQSRIGISELAAMENLSETHFRTLFTRLFGESPVEYITARRMEAAIDMLENTDKKLSEISALVGYSDAYYFGRLFKKKFGISPGRYRRSRESGSASKETEGEIG